MHSLATSWQRNRADTLSAPRQLVVAAFVWGVAVALTIRLFLFVNQYAVDVLFSDQWVFWQGLFDGADLWTMWRWQHGPHRQGVGQMIVVAVASLTGWNVRAEAFVSTAVVTLAMAVALAIARALRGRWSAADICIPFLVVTLSQFELFVVTPNPAHGPLPLLLVMSFGLALLSRRPQLRAIILGGISSVAVQTGFGFFLGIVALPILGTFLVDAIRRRSDVLVHVAALTLVTATFALFFYGYHRDPAVTCFRFPDPHPYRYPLFLSLLFFRSLEWNGAGPTVYLGLALPVACAGLVAWGGWRMFASSGRERLPTVAFAFSAFSLLFALSATIGRVCLYPNSAWASRYVPYLMPFLTAAYLVLSAHLRQPRSRTAIFVALCVFLATKELVGTRLGSVVLAKRYAVQKSGWRDCCLAGGSAKSCWAMYPAGALDEKANHTDEKLRFMRDHHLNLFRDTTYR